jgi:CubicO group peptidase (beta-lactamase class C family)
MLTATLLAMTQSPPATPPPLPARPAAEVFAGEPAAVAVSFDRRRITVRLVRGEAERRTHRPVTADDPVRVASVSKWVVALGVMRLVEAGTLDLDRDVSDYLGWRLRSPHHPDRVITLAHLLGHRSGLTDRINYILPLDADLEPMLADAGGWDADRPPGGAFAYANINFPIIAAAMEGATGQRFDQIMQAQVMRPLNIDACYNWSGCSDAMIARAVTLYRPSGIVAADDLNGRPPPCPSIRASNGSCDLSLYRLARNGGSFGPQGGLRISMNGLARLGQMWLRAGEGFLSRRSLARIAAMQPVTATASTGGEGGEGSFFCRYGLAMQQLATRTPGCRDDPFGDGRQRIGHVGEAYSLRSGIWLDPGRGTGVVYFVTGNPEFDAPAGAISAFSAAEEAMAAVARGRPR